MDEPSVCLPHVENINLIQARNKEQETNMVGKKLKPKITIQHWHLRGSLNVVFYNINKKLHNHLLSFDINYDIFIHHFYWLIISIWFLATKCIKENGR